MIMNKRRTRDTVCETRKPATKLFLVTQQLCLTILVITSLLPEGSHAVVIPEKIRSAIDNGFGRRLSSFSQQSSQSRSSNPGGYCDEIITTETAWISSPNYPLDYDANAICVYTIRTFDDVCQLEFMFEDFDLEDSRPTCMEDYVELGSGNRLCGSLIPDFKREYSLPIVNEKKNFQEEGQQ